MTLIGATNWHENCVIYANNGTLERGELVIQTRTPTYGFANNQVAIPELDGTFFPEILNVWEGLRNDAFAPRWDVGDMLLYPAAAIPYFTVVEVSSETPELLYRFWGSGHVDVKGVDHTGRAPIEHEPREHGRTIDREYRFVLEARTPCAFVHEIYPRNRPLPLYQECVRMPLSNDGETVTHVISYSDWQTESEKWKSFFRNQ